MIHEELLYSAACQYLLFLSHLQAEPGLIPEAGGNGESKAFAENAKILGVISCALLGFLYPERALERAGVLYTKHIVNNLHKGTYLGKGAWTDQFKVHLRMTTFVKLQPHL